MRATAKGQLTRAEFTRVELWALLSFAGTSEHYSVLHLRVNGQAKLQAAATDGRRSVEAVGNADKAVAGEWAIDAVFLETCRKAIGKDQALVLELQKSGVKDALVVDATGGDTICRLGWTREIADTQMSLGEIVTGLQIPTSKRHTGSWCAIDPCVLKPLERIRVATDKCPITLYPPTDPLAPLFFEARSDAAHWRGAILTERVLGPGDEADEPEEDPKPGAPLPPQRSLFGPDKPAPAPKREAAADADGIVEDDYGKGEPDLPTAKKSASEKAGAKAQEFERYVGMMLNQLKGPGRAVTAEDVVAWNEGVCSKAVTLRALGVLVERGSAVEGKIGRKKSFQAV